MANKFNIPTTKNLDELSQLLNTTINSSQLKTNPADLEAYGKDWVKGITSDASCVVFPKTTQEVSKVLKYCYDQNLAVVPSGGRTGLAGGAVAQNKEIVLSLEKMNKIEELNPISMTIRCEAGVTTQKIQEVAKDAGFFFALDLAAKGSSQIGGNISTNAGGLKLIRYGGCREQVLGLEVVLGNGEILDLNSDLKKNNTGYDLKYLFIGAEGTLGVVTKATLKLSHTPQDMQIACLGVKSFNQILKVLERFNEQATPVTAFEFFSDKALKAVLSHQKTFRSPFSETYPFYVLIEYEKLLTGKIKDMMEFLGSLIEEDIASDAVISHSDAEFKALWALRENISESVNVIGHVYKNDISVSIHKLAAFVGELERELAIAPKEIDLILFGHIGDGNLHLNYIGPSSLDKAEFKKLAKSFEQRVFELLKCYKGSISAEHGIGLVKKHDLHFSRSEEEILWMKKIKTLFDPKGILNPGKVFL